MGRRFTFAFPHNGTVSVPFLFSVVNMMMYERGKDKDHCLLGSFLEAGSCHVPFNRNTISSKFLNETTDDYVVMMDTDVETNPLLLETLDGLITEYSNHYPIWDRVNYPHIISGRVDISNGMPVFYKRFAEGNYKHDPRPFKGLKHFGGVGSGIIAISRWCLATIVNESHTYHFFGHSMEKEHIIPKSDCDNPAHLKTPYDLGKLMSDDFSFCKVARDHGFMPYGAWDIRGIHHKTDRIRPMYYETLEQYEEYKKANPEGIPDWLKDSTFEDEGKS